MALVRTLYSAEASTENEERWAIFEEELLQAGCGGNHTQTAGYKSTAKVRSSSGAIWLEKGTAHCTSQTRSNDDAKHAFKWLQQSGFAARNGLA